MLQSKLLASCVWSRAEFIIVRPQCPQILQKTFRFRPHKSLRRFLGSGPKNPWKMFCCPRRSWRTFVRPYTFCCKNLLWVVNSVYSVYYRSTWVDFTRFSKANKFREFWPDWRNSWRQILLIHLKFKVLPPFHIDRPCWVDFQTIISESNPMHCNACFGSLPSMLLKGVRS